MTRIIKKSKKKRIEEPEVEPVEEGKDLSQSGNFFQNNKLLITWILVLAFAATCIGVTSMTSCSGKSTNQIESENLEKDRNNLDKILERAKKSLDEEDSIANHEGYAYASESLANRIMSEIFTSEDKEETNRDKLLEKHSKFEKHRAEAIKHYEIVLNKMGIIGENSENTDNADISDYSEIDRNCSDLSKLYIQTEQYQKVIDLALKDKNVKEILDAPKDKIEETAKKLIETESADGVVLENSDFVPLLSNYIIAKANTGKYNEVEQYVDTAMKYDGNNIVLLLLVAQDQIDKGKLDEARETLAVANNVFSNSIMAYSAANEVKDKNDESQLATIPYDYIMVAPQIYSMSGDIAMKQNNKAQAALYYDFGLKTAEKLGDGKLAEELLKKRASTGVEFKKPPVEKESKDEAQKEEQKNEPESGEETAK